MIETETVFYWLKMLRVVNMAVYSNKLQFRYKSSLIRTYRTKPVDRYWSFTYSPTISWSEACFELIIHQDDYEVLKSNYSLFDLNIFYFISTKEEMGLDEEKSYVCPLTMPIYWYWYCCEWLVHVITFAII